MLPLTKIEDNINVVLQKEDKFFCCDELKFVEKLTTTCSLEIKNVKDDSYELFSLFHQKYLKIDKGEYSIIKEGYKLVDITPKMKKVTWYISK